MSEPDELSISELRRRRMQTGSGAGGGSASEGSQPASVRVIDVASRSDEARAQIKAAPDPRDPGRWIRAITQRWQWLVSSALVLGIIGMAGGFSAGRFGASVTLVQRDTTSAFAASQEGEPFKPRQFSAATMIRLMASPELARTVATEAKPPVTEAALSRSVMVKAAPQTELVIVTMSGRNREALVGLLNLYAQQAVSLTRAIQREESTRMNLFFQEKLRQTDGELEKVRSELEGFQKEEQVSDPETEAQTLLRQLGDIMSRSDSAHLELDLLEVKSAEAQHGELAQQVALMERIKKARDQVSALLTRKTEAHPEVIAVRAEIAELERQLTNVNGSAAGMLNLALLESNARKATLTEEIKRLGEQRDSLQKRISGLSQKGLQYQIIKARRDSLFRGRQILANRQREAQLYEENAQGYYRVLAEATLADVSDRGRILAAILGLAGGLAFGVLVAVTGVLLVEVRDDRLKTAADVRRVTGVPLLCTLGDLNKMSPEEKDHWAFRAWTVINGKLNRTPDRGLVCGFISATDGEGKSTWIDLLASAANQRGLRVLKIVARSQAKESPAAGKGSSPETDAKADPTKIRPASDTATSTNAPTAKESASVVISNALTHAAEVTKQLAGPSAVEIPLPDWVWNLEHRRQWQSALTRWTAVDNVVILVELPAAALPEAVLLAENVPQLIWLVSSGKPRMRETRLHLETLKHAHCQIVGAVLNRASDSLHHV